MAPDPWRGTRLSHTKIICTLGPACETEAVLREMLRAGMDVGRLNFSHGDHASHARRISLVRRLAAEEGKPVAILGDLAGPKLRLGALPGGEMRLLAGSNVTISPVEEPGCLPFPEPAILQALRRGQRLLLDDGAIELAVERNEGGRPEARVVTGGRLRSHAGVVAPGAALSMPALGEKDRDDARFAVEQAVDYLALSFVRGAADVEGLRDLLKKLGARIPIVAKIEVPEAVASFDEILAASDGVMVARGDLGVNTSPEEVPFYQKRFLLACNRAGKPSITATQMLQSMISSPRPTRAEASDVANAVLDGSDAVMLSGETAIGEFPVEAVRTMDQVARRAEEALDPEECLRRVGMVAEGSQAIARATVEIAQELGVRAIITSTISGHTARMVARFRPRVPVIAATPDPATWRQMALVWGVVPLQVGRYDTIEEMLALTTAAARDAGVVRTGDQVVVTAGMPAGGEGLTNMLKVHTV
jgi:pyruvate kinase